ncbi:MAG: hypothetical protein QOK32_1307 [Gaiellaceae bacterium]|jgi:hypothetical protein|nr:hypothetical protein [Gaiellaceae bacterium]MDX6492211.1 hypothetical protein [Gaiellaceae bacterium]MDX6543704.1 hypothetical protein [Gaiellaceae bacterium]
MPKSLAADQKAKVKKQKIILAVGGVLLLGLLAFQVPKMLAMMSQKPPPLPPGAVVQPPNGFPAGTAPLAAPSLGGSNGTAGAATSHTSTGIVDASAVSSAPASGQLVAFGRFSSKDPFAPQVDTSPGGGPPSSGSSGGTSTPKPVPPVGPLGPTPGGAVPSNLPLPTTALISVNGTPEVVGIGVDFPVAAPVFHLVSLTRTSAKIAIAGGSYADGSATITLKKGKALTLENTSDGSRYVLKLIALDAVLVPAGTPGSTTISSTPTSTTPLTP